jgi:TRAP-type mannitol/chloroaromatic compound transport system permease small subunit
VVLDLIVALLFIKLSLGYVAQAWSIGETSPDPGGIPGAGPEVIDPCRLRLLVLQSVGALLRTVGDCIGNAGAPACLSPRPTPS